MRKSLIVLIALLFSSSLLAEVHVCVRTAEVMFGIADHAWLRTDSVEAGMGGPIYEDEQIGDRMELPYITKVYVRDHSGYKARKCMLDIAVDEDCVNEELEMDKYLGRWRPLNQCQSYVHDVRRKCEKPEFKEIRNDRTKIIRYQRELRRKKNKGNGPTYGLERRLERLLDKYNGEVPPDYDIY